MGSRRTRLALRRRAAIALAVWALALSLLALVAAIPSGPVAVLAVDTAFPAVGEVVHFNASGSLSHDAGNGRIVSYAFSFGDGYGTGSQSSPFAAHAYTRTETFVATVTVVDGRGTQSSASVTMHPGSSPPPSPGPDLSLVHAQMMPAEPQVNDSVNVTVVILNRGGGTATSATLSAFDVPENGSPAAVARTDVSESIAPAETLNLTLGPFIVALAGNHTLRILVTNVTPAETTSADHELDLPFTVTASIPGGHSGGGPPFEFSPLAIGLGATAVAAGVGAAYLLLRPRPPGPLEPPPASPPDRSPPPIWPP